MLRDNDFRTSSFESRALEPSHMNSRRTLVDLFVKKIVEQLMPVPGRFDCPSRKREVGCCYPRE
jgi:hypothetical protein